MVELQLNIFGGVDAVGPRVRRSFERVADAERYAQQRNRATQQRGEREAWRASASAGLFFSDHEEILASLPRAMRETLVPVRTRRLPCGKRMISSRVVSAPPRQRRGWAQAWAYLFAAPSDSPWTPSDLLLELEAA